MRVPRTTGLLTVFFADADVIDYDGARGADLDAHAAFCRAMLDRGVYVAALPVRGLVPLARPRGGGGRADARGGRARVPRGRRATVTALVEVAASVGDELAPYAIRDPGRGRFEELVADPDRAFVIEAVYEGHLLHHGEPRAFRGMDPDLRLLAGDALYALGLARLARLGDIEAVGELADLIALSARCQAEGRTDLGDALWRSSAAFLSPGGGPGARATFEAAGPRDV